MLLGDFRQEKNNSFWVLQLFFIPNSLKKAHLSFTVLWNCVFLPCFGRVWRLQSQWGYPDGLFWPGAALCPTAGACLESCILEGMIGEQPGGSYPIPSPGASFLLCCLKEWKGDGKEQQLHSKKIITSLDRQGNSLNIVGFYRSACLCNMFVSLGTQVRL